MNNNDYVNIQGWMINELKLKGNDLMVYALIYGFSKDGESTFSGSLQYIADWCNSTKQGVQKNLKNLLDQGLITKVESTKNHIKFCEYSCIPYNSVARGMQLSCTNNIDNNINTNISKDIFEDPHTGKGTSGRAAPLPLLEQTSPLSDYELHMYPQPTRGKKKSGGLKSVPGERPVKLSLYDKCVSEIEKGGYSEELQQVLLEYLPIRLAMKDKPLLGVNQWKGMLRKLELMADQVDVVKQSVERGWAAFFDIQKSTPMRASVVGQSWNKNVKSNGMTMTKEDYEQMEKELEEMKQDGKRTVF